MGKVPARFKNVPPDQRPNWEGLNEGQKRYAMEQWYKSRVHRGEYFDPPVVGEAGPSNAKVPRIEEQNSSTTETTTGVSTSSTMAPTGPKAGTSSEPMDTDVSSSLPGTAMDQGAPAAAGGGPRPAPLPRPTLPLQSGIRTYRKVHRFLTWGIAYDIIDHTSSKDFKWMTTPFAMVPWDRPYFYMTPSEFNNLPDGANVTRVHIKIIPRNVRIAFPTNASTTNLATLNQNKDLVIADGLNINVHSLNAHYTKWQSDQPMIPTAFDFEDAPWHKQFYDDLYGKEDDTNVPRHQAGIACPLPFYAVIPKQVTNSVGWPCLQHYYQDWDADSTGGKQIADFTYIPKVGFLKKPYETVYNGYNVSYKTTQQVKIPHGSHNLTPHETVITYATNKKQQPQRREDAPSSLLPFDKQLYEYNTVIEKSQYIFIGNFDTTPPKIQPSVHIGIQPVPALTTASLAGQSNSSFTDASAYFEVVAEMTVETGYPTPYPHANYLHTTENGNVWVLGTAPEMLTRSTYNGLHQL